VYVGVKEGVHRERAR